jgi:stage III sporulation protein AA
MQWESGTPVKRNCFFIIPHFKGLGNILNSYACTNIYMGMGGEKVRHIEKDKRAEGIYRILALPLRRLLMACQLDFAKLQEIRLRIGAPLLLVYGGKEYFVDDGGHLSREESRSVFVSKEQIRETMEYISNYSMYAFEEELRQGYITVQGGHRVGVAGKMIWERQGAKNMKHISFLNIRLAHEVIGCSDSMLPYVLHNGRVHHTLIISPPRCGKTTLLRDLIRQLSDGGKDYDGMTVGVVDERSELGACYLGVPQNNLGCRTDILDGCPKVQGMMMLVRSMAPQVIAVDEVGSREDVEAMEYVMNCGVRLLATVHGNSIDDIKNKPVLGRMVRERVFERYILLQSGKVGQIEAVFDERGCILSAKQRGKEVQEREIC